MSCFCLAFVVVLFGTVAAPSASAMELVSVSGSEVNMRSGPGKKFPVFWHLDKGYPLQVLRRKGGWVKVRDFEGDQGWVFRSLLGSTPHMVVKVKLANIRATPSTRARKVGMAEYGVVLQTIKRDRHWVKVRHEDGLTGWVSRRLLWGW
jgi:SH3-like domain-containing protein